MENRLYLYNLGIKTFGGFATLGGVIQALQLFTQPDLDIKSILLSFPAWVVYVFVCLTIIFAMLRERYKSMSQRVEVLNVKLNEQDAMIRSLQEMMKIVPFKGRFFLTTEYLYNELGEYIQNNIDIDSIEIKNTIEKRGMGNKSEGGNLAASKIRNLECPSYEICLIDYGCGKFNRKIHIMEQYP